MGTNKLIHNSYETQTNHYLFIDCDVRKFILSNMTHCCRFCFSMIEIEGRYSL